MFPYPSHQWTRIFIQSRSQIRPFPSKQSQHMETWWVMIKIYQDYPMDYDWQFETSQISRELPVLIAELTALSRLGGRFCTSGEASRPLVEGCSKGMFQELGKDLSMDLSIFPMQSSYQIHTNTYIYICVSLNIYVSLFIYIYIYMCIHIYVSLNIYIYMYPWIYMYPYIDMYPYIHMYSYIYIYAYTSIYIYIYKYVCINIHTYTHMNMVICMQGNISKPCTYIYIYIYKYIYIQMYVYGRE